MSECTEVWLPVAGYESTYEVSSLGNLRRMTPKMGTRAGRFLKGNQDGFGYTRIALRAEDGKKKDYLLSRIVCEAFHGAPSKEAPYCLHKNGNPRDNRSDNLYWGSQKQNMADAIRHGTMIRGERQGCSVLREHHIPHIRNLRKAGVTQEEIAARLGVSRTCIASVDQNRTWRHVP